MSLVKNTGFKKMECGDLHHSEQMLRDTGGGYVDLQIVGTDPEVGVVDGSAMIADYRPSDMNPDGTFMICIEAAGIFYVTLFDGSDFVITTVQSTAYLGQWYPARIWSVNVGTKVESSSG